MINSVIDLLELERVYRQYLLSQNVSFDDRGFPLFRPAMFLYSWPDTIVTYQCRNNRTLVKDPHKTALCFFTSDSRIYPRLENVFEELAEYKRFAAVVGMDLTFTDDMEPELQQLILMINQLFTMILAVNGIKIIINTRSGGLEYSTVFGSIPKGVAVSSGFLGCKGITDDNYTYLCKMLFLLPGKILIYGKHDPIAESQLDRFGFVYRVYSDVHRQTKYKELIHG